MLPVFYHKVMITLKLNSCHLVEMVVSYMVTLLKAFSLLDLVNSFKVDVREM